MRLLGSDFPETLRADSLLASSPCNSATPVTRKPDNGCLAAGWSPEPQGDEQRGSMEPASPAICSEEALQRTRRLLGDSAMERLQKSRVLLFGIGGVGGHCAEALARSGVGSLTLVDNDEVAVSNLNRQLFATAETVGLSKLDAAKKRLLAVAPNLSLTLLPLFFLPENAQEVDFGAYDYVIDAVDTVAAKIAIIEGAKKAGTPVISCMGTGNKLHPELLELEDISKTSVCPLARVMRRELKKRGILHVPVVYSREEPLTPMEDGESFPETSSRWQIPGSTAFVPAAAGLILAGAVVRALGMSA